MSKIMEAFTIVHGEMTGSCYTEIVEDEYMMEEIAVNVMKDGNLCWTVTREQLAFELAFRAFKAQEECGCCKPERYKD